MLASGYATSDDYGIIFTTYDMLCCTAVVLFLQPVACLEFIMSDAICRSASNLSGLIISEAIREASILTPIHFAF